MDNFIKNFDVIQWTPSYAVTNLFVFEKEFSRLNFVGVVFEKVKFVRCKFHGCDLSHSIFRECDIYDCNFNNSILYFSQFISCELTKSNFSDAYLLGIRFNNCNMTRTEFGTNFKVGVNRKIDRTQPCGKDINILEVETFQEIPIPEELETKYDGIKSKTVCWYIHFIKDDNSDWRIARRKAIVASHIADQLQKVGRGDSSEYQYLSLKFFNQAKENRVGRLFGIFQEILWGYGYRPWRLLINLVIANLFVIMLYFIIGLLNYGYLADNGNIINCGGAYYFFSAFYYSVVVATTLGFGDIVPHGLARVILIIQVLINITLIALWFSTITSPWRGR